MRRYHFIAGLPRSGSTLLSAILSQNPAFSAAMSGPLFPIFNAALSAMGGGNEYAVFLNEAQKKRMLRGLFDGYYADNPARVVFDTNRMWSARLPALRQLYPQAKIIACVRNPAWVIDSIEVLVRKNALDTMRLFGSEAERLSVYARANGLMERNRLVGSAYLALKEAYYSQEAGGMLLLGYDALVSHPREAMAMVYQFLGEPWFEHDFENVFYKAEIFDTFMLAKGLHDVSGRVEARTRPSILPPDLFKRFAAMEFWGRGRQPGLCDLAEPQGDCRRIGITSRLTRRGMIPGRWLAGQSRIDHPVLRGQSEVSTVKVPPADGRARLDKDRSARDIAGHLAWSG